MRRALPIFAALAVATAVAGCGGGQKRTIPTKTAESMLAELDTIGTQFDNQSCISARARSRALAARAAGLPSSVDPEVKRNLVAGIHRLDLLIARDCQKQTNTNTNTTPTNTTPTTPTNTTPTNTTPTTPTNTTPTNTTPTNTTPTTPGGGGGVTVPGGTTGTGGVIIGGGGSG